MSINSAMLAGVSGLISNSSALAAISDNIANVNTVGYKRSSANFSTLVTSQSKNATYSAGGVKAQTHQFISQQGLTQATTSNLDLSIAGSGFFVGTEKPEGLTATDTRSFTRAGSFQLDNLGYLKNDTSCCTSFSYVLLVAAGGMGGGVAAATARALGAGRLDDARALVLHALVLGLGLALLFTLLAWTVAPTFYRTTF